MPRKEVIPINGRRAAKAPINKFPNKPTKAPVVPKANTKAPIKNTPNLPAKTPVVPNTPPKAPIVKSPDASTNATPNIPAQRANPKKIPYKYAGKESIIETIRKAIPKQFIPTKRLDTIFGLIFLLIIVIAAFQFPFGEIMKGEVNTTIEVGYPANFLVIHLLKPEESPLRLAGLIIDIIVYIILAYAIDVVITLIIQSPLIQSEEEAKKIPVVFKNKKITIAEKAAAKITATPARPK